MIDEGLAAYNNGDWEAYGASMVDDAVFQEVGTGGSGGIEGREQIIKAMTILQGWGARYERVGEILQNGNVVFFPIECDTCPRMTGEIDVVEFNDDLKVTHYWTIVSD